MPKPTKKTKRPLRSRIADLVEERGKKRGERLRDRAIRLGEYSRKPDEAAFRALDKAERTEERHRRLAEKIRGKKRD